MLRRFLGLFCDFVLFLNLLLECCDSLLHVFRRLFVLLFQIVELLIQVNTMLGGYERGQKHYNHDYRDPIRFESAAHALDMLSP